MTRAVLSLGSNLGDRAGYLRAAVVGLGEELLVVSGVYESPPWPAGEPGPAYLNAVVLVAAASADPQHWLARARALEAAAGRERDAGHRYAPRTLDIDVIMVWDATDQPVRSADPELTLPHPRAHLRAFVLRPWIDIQPYAVLSGHGPLTDLLRSGPIGAQLAHLHPRPDLPIDPDQPIESGR